MMKIILLGLLAFGLVGCASDYDKCVDAVSKADRIKNKSKADAKAYAAAVCAKLG